MKVTGHMIGFLSFAICCFVYGIVMRMNASGTGFYLIWFGLAVIFGMFAILSSFQIWMKLPGFMKMIARILVIAIAVLLVILNGLIISCFHKEKQAGLDYIVVLGAQVKEQRPSVVLSYRLREAELYLKENPNTICIVSGGQGNNETSTEASVMGTYLRQRGIDAERILYEDQSTSTKENILFSRSLIPENASIGIVTNNFHMYRALKIAEKYGMKDAHGIAADSMALYLPHNMLREVFGVAVFYLGGIISQ